MARGDFDLREGRHTAYIAATRSGSIVSDAALRVVRDQVRSRVGPAVSVEQTRHDTVPCLAITAEVVGRNKGLFAAGQVFASGGAEWIWTDSDFAWLKTHLRQDTV